MIRRVLKSKGATLNNDFWEVFNNIEDYVSVQHMNQLITQTVLDIRTVIGNDSAGYGWSGGKDSVVIDFLMSILGSYPSIVSITGELEYPEMKSYILANLPDKCEVFDSGHTLDWLSKNQHWLFPKNAQELSRWYKVCQHKAQTTLNDRHRLKYVIVGRRKQDGNHVGKNNLSYNKQAGKITYSPIADWSHEEVLACMKYFNLPVAPCYFWPNGFSVGTTHWAETYWAGSLTDSWRVVHRIDPQVVITAAAKIDSANRFLNSL